MRASTLLNFFVLPLAFGFPHFGNLLSEENSVRLAQLNQELPIQGTTLKPNHFKWMAPGPDDRTTPFSLQRDVELAGTPSPPR